MRAREGVCVGVRWEEERELFIDNPLVQIHLILEMTVVDRPCAMGVPISR